MTRFAAVHNLLTVWMLGLLCQVNLCPAPHVALIDTVQNARTLSLFKRGKLKAYGSKYNFHVIDDRQYCDLTAFATSGEEPRAFVRVVLYAYIPIYCTGNHFCIVTGDERCKAPVQSTSHKEGFQTILRQYYSSKYAYPPIPLGPRYDFDIVTLAERKRHLQYRVSRLAR